MCVRVYVRNDVWLQNAILYINTGLKVRERWICERRKFATTVLLKREKHDFTSPAASLRPQRYIVDLITCLQTVNDSM